MTGYLRAKWLLEVLALAGVHDVRARVEERR